MRPSLSPSSPARAHLVWLLGAASFLFAGVVWSGTQAHAVDVAPAEAARRAAEREAEDRVALLGRLQLAGIAARRAGPARSPAAAGQAAPSSPSGEALALARYVTAVGPDSLESALLGAGDRLAARVLADERITLGSAGTADVSAGRIDPRVLALLLYLAEAHGQVTVSTLVTGHARYVAQTDAERERRAPRRVSAHVGGRAVDISSVGGVPVLGNQLPGGIVERVVEEILALPAAIRPRQVITLLDLSGPSFRLPDHADHLHVGF